MGQFPRICTYAADGMTTVWAECAAPFPCGHQVKLRLPAIIAEHRDMPLDQLKARLRCTGCGWRPGAIRLVRS